MTFDALETSTTFYDFSGLPWGTPRSSQILRPSLVGGSAMLCGLYSKTLVAGLGPQPLSTLEFQIPKTPRFKNHTFNTLEHCESAGYLRSRRDPCIFQSQVVTTFYFWEVGDMHFWGFWRLRSRILGFQGFC